MIRSLVVDDNAERRAAVVRFLREAAASAAAKIVEAEAVVPAKVALAEEVFDILIVDIALPRRIGDNVSMDGGLQLLAALNETEILNTPTQIVAITAYEDLHVAAAGKLLPSGVALIHYDRSDGAWQSQLQELLARFVAAKNDQSLRDDKHGCDVAVVCALADPELTSVLRLPWSWRTSRFDHDSTTYHEGAANTNHGRWRVVAAAAARKGMPAAAALASKICSEFRPRYLAMVGVAAGNEEKTRLGDVLVADPSWDAGSGKWTLKDGKVEFEQAPNQLPLDNTIREALRSLSRDSLSLASIRIQWPGTKPAHELRMIIGPLASTSAVIADGVTMGAIANQHREVIGLEMEAYGVFAAAETACRPRPIAFAMKSVVDFGDPDKGDAVREYAAYTSAETLKTLVERHL